jgi:hypothetical protein
VWAVHEVRQGIDLEVGSRDVGAGIIWWEI